MVGTPLDASGRAACSLLDEAQLRGLSVDPASAEDETNDLAFSCRWASAGRAATIILDVTLDSPMERVYRALEPLGDPQQFDLRGYPAAREGKPGSSVCTVYAAVADTQVISVEATTRSADRDGRACDLAQRGVEAVMDTLSSQT